MRAASRMPNATFVRKGVQMRGPGLFLPETVEEFFSALAAVIGDDATDGVVEYLTEQARRADGSIDAGKLADNFLGGAGLIGETVMKAIETLDDPAQRVQTLASVGGFLNKMRTRKKRKK
jgi:hypothetical protein